MEYGIIKDLKFLLDCVLELIYYKDEKCILCEKDIYDDRIICKTCEDNIKICEDSFEIGYDDKKFQCYSSAYYSGTMMELIIKLKYKNSFRAGDVVANCMKNTIVNNHIDFDAFTYVPMTKKALKKRGYNQAEYLANSLKKYTDKPVISCLSKVKETKDQIGLSKMERWNNMRGSFTTYNKKRIKDKKILLIDDVLTTGATAFECCMELFENGVGEINVLTGAKSRV